MRFSTTSPTTTNSLAMMEHPRLKIAVITPNVLMNIGLKSILERIVPIADVYTFTSVAEMNEEEEKFYHCFVSAQIFIENNALFLGGGLKPIVLTDSAAPIANLAGLPHLNINQGEEPLVKDILRLHHGAHPERMHISHILHHPHPSHKNEPTIPSRNEEVLSSREIEVLSLIVKGLLNKEIADRLGIGLTTVISHRRNIVEKLGMRSVSAMTIYAVMRGYVNINEI